MLLFEGVGLNGRVAGGGRAESAEGEDWKRLERIDMMSFDRRTRWGNRSACFRPLDFVVGRWRGSWHSGGAVSFSFIPLLSYSCSP